MPWGEEKQFRFVPSGAVLTSGTPANFRCRDADATERVQFPCGDQLQTTGGPDHMLIIFGGLPGVGKTAIAAELARVIDALYLRIDSIEQAIRASGVVSRPR